VTDFGLAEVVAVPIQGAASDETGQKVVGAESSAGPDDEKAQSCGKEDVRLVVDPLPTLNFD
jgi:hypothetical protein